MSRQRRPATSIENASRAAASFIPPRETYGQTDPTTSILLAGSISALALLTTMPLTWTQPASMSACACPRLRASFAVTRARSRRMGCQGSQMAGVVLCDRHGGLVDLQNLQMRDGAVFGPWGPGP